VEERGWFGLKKLKVFNSIRNIFLILRDWKRRFKALVWQKQTKFS
jgi:hypothetical protein